MKMKNKTCLFIISFVMVPWHFCASQIWIGTDDFNSPTLDPSKWSGGGANFVKTPTSVTFFSNLNTGTVSDYILWSNNLPTDVNWSVTVQASISPSFSTGDSTKFAEALLVIASNDFNSYFTNCLHRDDTFDIVPNWEINSGGNQELLSTIGMDTVLLKMEFNASTQSITSSHASLLDPSNFTATKTLSTAGWGSLNNFVVAIGLYTKDASIPSGQLTLDNFSIVPEPAPIATLFLGLGTLGLLRCTRSKCPAKESEG